jgi:hypothetical protein
VEGFEMTLDNLQSLIDEDVVMHGAALCVGRTLASDGSCHPICASTS